MNHRRQNSLRPIRSDAQALADIDLSPEYRAVLQYARTLNVKDIETRIKNGDNVSPRDLHIAALIAGPEAKAQLRNALVSFEAIARNQDLVAPHLKAALEGNENSRNFIEKNRIIIEESTPDWFRSTWESEKTAAWRSLDLHSKTVRRAANQFKASVLPQYKNVTLGEFGTLPPAQDIRAGLLVYASRINAMELIEKSATSTHHTKDSLFKLMKAEIEKGLIIFESPTIIGHHLRSVVKIEAKRLFVARLVEDVCFWCDLPISDEAKVTLWQQFKIEPWSIANHPLVVNADLIRKILASQEIDESSLVLEYDKLVNSDYCKKIIREYNNKTKEQEILVSNKPSHQPTETKAKTTESAKFLDDIPRSTRLEILAALEVFCEDDGQLKDHARKLSKLLVNEPQLFQETMHRIYSGAKPEDLIESLRRSRPLSVLKSETKVGGNELSQVSHSIIIEPEEIVERPVIYTDEALAQMKDGRLRHAVDKSIQKFVKSPALIDRKKVQNMDDIWEIRLVSQGIRIYYCEPGDNKLAIVYVGHKRDQEKDLKRLPAIRQKI